ncbi:MAG: SRPBCC family protein [Anaerolineae bacterium]
MKEIRAEVEIDAPAERVWQILSNFAAYPHWNPFIRRISGRAKTDSRLEVYIQPSGARGMSLKPVVRRCDANRELRWQGRLWGVPYLVDGEYCFTIEPIGSKRVRFAQRETFKGLLVPVFAGYLDRDVRRGIEEMNQALKTRAEEAQTTTQEA